MKNVHRFLLAAVLLSALPLALTAQPLSQEQLEAIAIQPAGNWGKTGSNVVPEMLPLFKEESIQFGGQTRKYRLHVPEKFEPNQKYPMILWLHGAGECGDDNKLQLVHLHHIITYLTGEKKRDFFLLVPQQSRTDMCSWGSEGGTNSYGSAVAIPPSVKNNKDELEQYIKKLLEQTKAASPGDAAVTIEHNADDDLLFVNVSSSADNHPLEYAFAMVEQVLEKYPVDKDRITVSGLSTGGDGTWRALERRPDLFAAAVPLVSWDALTDAAMEKSPILKKIPIWAIYSSDDNSIDSARADFERVEKAGANVKKTEFGICGHSAWTPAMLQADIFAWLLSRAKKGDEYIAVFDPGVNPDDMKGIVDVATRDPGRPTLAPVVATQPVVGLRPPVAAGQIYQTPQLQEQKFIDLRTPDQVVVEMAVVGSDGIVQLRQVTVPPPVLTVMPDGTTRASGPVIMRNVVPPFPAAINSETEKAYIEIARKYFLYSQITPSPDLMEEALQKFSSCAAKVSQAARIKLIIELAEQTRNVDGLPVLEKLLDEMPVQPLIPAVHYQPGMNHPYSGGAMPAEPPYPVVTHEVDSAVCISAERIIEECNRPWAMTSGSLYGLFPNDWDKEAADIPDFVVNSASDGLAKQLARSVGEDPESKDFIAACKSVLLLTNKPMSSPWFETSGGRLRSEIQYSLSTKGQMFVRFLRTVKESGGNSDKAKELSKVADKTLEKIGLVLAK